MATSRDSLLILVVLNKTNLFELTGLPHEEDYKETVDNNIMFIDDRGARTHGNLISKDYETEVWNGKKMIWVILDTGTDSTYKIKLKEVNHISNEFTTTKFFDNNKYPLKPDYVGIITESIKTGFADGDKENYSITFEITDPTGNTKNIVVDPKLKIITQ